MTVSAMQSISSLAAGHSETVRAAVLALEDGGNVSEAAMVAFFMIHSTVPFQSKTLDPG